MNNVEELVKSVINEINSHLVEDNKLKNVRDEKLNSEGSKLDSLAMLTFISILEEQVSDIDFMDILMGGDEDKILETIGSLTTYLKNK